ncbi:MAG: iron-containing redox enzyme family protein [Gammaproteobacteria bacterium]|nr:iron-containing redox enzyme family protein [Gammaproteobacteria bacterium]
MQGRNYLKNLKDELLEHPLFDDPLIENITSVSVFETDKAQKFANLYYPHILRTRLYQASTLGITPDENIQFVLSGILYDEYGLGNSTKSHMQLYRNFMQAIGLDIKPYSQYKIIPELQMYISAMEQLTRNGDWLSAVAAVGVASEWPIPKYYQLLLNGLRKIPGINDANLELFVGHIELDIEHSEMIEQSVLPYLNDPENQKRFDEGIKINMDARRVLHAGLNREIFES